MSAPTDALPLPDPYLRVYDGGPIAKFANSHLQESIQAAVAGLGPTESGAVVAFVDRAEVKLAVVARHGAHWSAVGVLSHGLADDATMAGEFAVRYTW